jgi:hypothetical protein
MRSLRVRVAARNRYPKRVNTRAGFVKILLWLGHREIQCRGCVDMEEYRPAPEGEPSADVHG